MKNILRNLNFVFVKFVFNMLLEFKLELVFENGLGWLYV